MNKLIIGDIHLNKNKSEYFKNILFPVLTELNNSYNYNEIIFLGDIFTSSIIDNVTLKLFKDFISLYNNKKVKILVGNHDIISTTENIFDLFLLNKNINIYDNLSFDKEEIYIPYITKSNDYSIVFKKVKEYIDSTDFDNYYIYSHNDFAEVYKFKSNFFNISDVFSNCVKNIYLINGHNHVPFFKSIENFKILNIGCAINLNYNDTGLINNYLYINNEDIKVIQNKYSIKYYTFHIYKEDDIVEFCKKLTNYNLSYLKFIIHYPSIIISDEFKSNLRNNYLIGDIHIEYELESLADIAKKCNIDSTVSIDNICEKLNINIEEFNVKKEDEKYEILLSLLYLMFENRQTSDNDTIKVINVIKKYLI